MLDFRFDGEKLFLWIEKNTTSEELKLLLEEKIRSIHSFIEEGICISVVLENGIEQSDLIPYLVQNFMEKNIKMEAIYFDKPSKKPISKSQLSLVKDGLKKEELPQKESEGNLKKSRLIFSSVRSGQVIEHDGDIIIVGNVNLGAEIHGFGNLIVFGDIKGTVKVGNYDPENSYILAMNMHPNLLQIGSVYSNSISSDGLALCVIKNGRLSLEPVVNVEFIKDYLKN